MSLFKRYALTAATLGGLVLGTGVVGCGDDNNVIAPINYTVVLEDANVSTTSDGLIDLDTGDLFSSDDVNADVDGLSPKIDLIYVTSEGSGLFFNPAFGDGFFPALWVGGVKNATDIRISTELAFDTVEAATSDEARIVELEDAFANAILTDGASQILFDDNKVYSFKTTDGNIGIAKFTFTDTAEKISVEVWVE